MSHRSLQTNPPSSTTTSTSLGDYCLLHATAGHLYEPQAEDILCDENLLDLFRIIKQVLRKKRDPERLARLFFCVSYALGDHVKFHKPVHENKIIFDDRGFGAHAVRLPGTSSCCLKGMPREKLWPDTASMSSSSASSTSTSASPITKLLSVPYMTHQRQQAEAAAAEAAAAAAAAQTQQQTVPGTPTQQQNDPLMHPGGGGGPPPPAAPPSVTTTARSPLSSSDDTSTDAYTVRPYTNFRPLYPADAAPSPPTHPLHLPPPPPPTATPIVRRYDTPPKFTPLGNALEMSEGGEHGKEFVMEPKQRGFYYQDGRITREPVLLQRYAEHGILTHASLMRKRKRQTSDQPTDLMTPSPVVTKKPKIPHRHGEFEQRRDDIIGRMRSITITDLEQKAERLPEDYSLAIEQVAGLTPEAIASPERAAELLEPSLRILTNHSNMKPHLDNGMNQNGIYYNTDYFRLYLAFEQFQSTFAVLFPNEVVKMPQWGSEIFNNNSDFLASYASDRDRDRDRNANMKAYRSWIEPLLTETNWAAFRRNIVVGERMMQLTKVVGQGVLLMTKELSGSKLHLTFTNNEWDEFITGLSSGRWDQTIHWDVTPTTAHTNGTSRNNNGGITSLLVNELRQKFATIYWFHPEGLIMSTEGRRAAITAENNSNNNDK
ncbi:hypothetical protein BDA99DRAFT_532270 [Phascolomyces articulosus]|uniref:Uncharacterized protein n=1 Tax=Phascolomyces articulosus TaxID=60185 RepID=A0AAD5KB54_9FUNG|nr:hypothetical protein BDA99DRAFT_532270 [Phascolomyces articulosus]